MNRFTFLIGLGFGCMIVASRFSDYRVIHYMLLLRESDLHLIMASSFAVAMPMLLVLRRRSWKTPLGGELELNRVKAERKHIFMDQRIEVVVEEAAEALPNARCVSYCVRGTLSSVGRPPAHA